MSEEAVSGVPAAEAVCESAETVREHRRPDPRPADPFEGPILQTALIVAVILTPIAVSLVYLDWTTMPTYEWRSRLAVAAGVWAVFAIWIILDKGLESLLGRLEVNPAFLWLVVGVINLGAALATLSRLAPSLR